MRFSAPTLHRAAEEFVARPTRSVRGSALRERLDGSGDDRDNDQQDGERRGDEGCQLASDGPGGEACPRSPRAARPLEASIPPRCGSAVRPAAMTPRDRLPQVRQCRSVSGVTLLSPRRRVRCLVTAGGRHASRVPWLDGGRRPRSRLRPGPPCGTMTDPAARTTDSAAHYRELRNVTVRVVVSCVSCQWGPRRAWQNTRPVDGSIRKAVQRPCSWACTAKVPFLLLLVRSAENT